MIEVKNLVKIYGNHRAVDDLSFTVETGKVVGFLGPNGAGKSTTMNMITGYIAPTSGKVLIDGVDMAQEPEKAKKHIGYLPEIPPLYPDLRIIEYLQFVAELKKVPKKERDMAVYQVMKKTKVTDMSQRLIKHLSKGYKQRVGLAAAMIGEPDILILDEPTVGLDPSQIMEIRELIRELSKDHTILLSSHIMQEISAVCHEIIIINNGKMIACDTPDHLIQQMERKNSVFLTVKGQPDQVKQIIESIEEIESADYEQEEKTPDQVMVTVYTGNDNDVREKLFYAMAQNHCPILEMRTLDSSLEDAFLALTQGDSHGEKGQKEEEKQTFHNREKEIRMTETKKEEEYDSDL